MNAINCVSFIIRWSFFFTAQVVYGNLLEPTSFFFSTLRSEPVGYQKSKSFYKFGSPGTIIRSLDTIFFNVGTENLKTKNSFSSRLYQV